MAHDLLSIHYPALNPNPMAWPLFWDSFGGRLAVDPLPRLAASAALLCGLFFAADASAEEAESRFRRRFAQEASGSSLGFEPTLTRPSMLQDRMCRISRLLASRSVADGPGVVPVINNPTIAKGNKVIFANSYGYGTFIPEIAKKHPEIHFIVPDGHDPKGPKNVALLLQPKLEEVRYLEGVKAGKMNDED